MGEFLERVIDHLPDMAVIVFDWNYRYKICRGPLHERLGYSREKMEGRTLYEVLGPESWALLEPLYERTLHGEDFTVEFQGTERPDVTFWVDFAPIYKGADVAYGLAIVKDVSEEKKAIERKALEKTKTFANDVLDRIGKAAIIHLGLITDDAPKSDLLLSANILLKIITSMQKQVKHELSAAV